MEQIGVPWHRPLIACRVTDTSPLFPGTSPLPHFARSQTDFVWMQLLGDKQDNTEMKYRRKWTNAAELPPSVVGKGSAVQNQKLETLVIPDSRGELNNFISRIHFSVEKIFTEWLQQLSSVTSRTCARSRGDTPTMFDLSDFLVRCVEASFQH